MKMKFLFLIFISSIPFYVLADDIIPGRFIVELRSDVNKEEVLKQLGLNAHFSYSKVFNGFTASMSKSIHGNLLKDRRILNIEPDQIVKVNEANDFIIPWGIDRIDQRSLPLNSNYNYVNTGASVTAYVVDTGIRYDHLEFDGRASLGVDVLGGDGSDCHGHGTHVSGIIGGVNYGVAKDVKIKSVRVLDCNGSGSVSGIIAGIDWIMAKAQFPAVANFSLGTSSISTTLDTAVKKLIFAGIPTVVAAGNSNKNACNFSPSGVPDAMTIGATRNDDYRASFSNFGSCVDWFSPGEGILSSFYTTSDATKVWSGTSMAAPHTSGVVALYLESHQNAKPIEVRDALLSFSTKGIVFDSMTSNNHLLYNQEMINGAGDFISPSTSMTSPSQGASYLRGWPLTMRASANDNGGIASVKFFVNGSLKCTDTTAPFSCYWRIPFLPSFFYSLETIAIDKYGNSKSSKPVTIRVY